MTYKLTIAIDYDDTFTAAPSLWSNMISQFRAAGHRFIMVTAREETESNLDQIDTDLRHYCCQMPVYCTNHESKLQFVRDRDIHVDIWIDDLPEMLVNGW